MTSCDGLKKNSMPLRASSWLPDRANLNSIMPTGTALRTPHFEETSDGSYSALPRLIHASTHSYRNIFRDLHFFVFCTAATLHRSSFRNSEQNSPHILKFLDLHNFAILCFFSQLRYLSWRFRKTFVGISHEYLRLQYAFSFCLELLIFPGRGQVGCQIRI